MSRSPAHAEQAPPDPVPSAGPAPDPEPERGEAWAEWDAGRPANGFTVLLACALLAVLAFGAGVLVQRERTSSDTAGAPAGMAGLPAGMSGFPGGGMPGGFGRPGSEAGAGSGGAAPGAGSGPAPSAASSARATDAPVAIGKVTSISAGSPGKIVVRTLGGTSVSVQVPATATVTTTGLAGRLAVGAAVVVRGTRAASGALTATSVTVR